MWPGRPPRSCKDPLAHNNLAWLLATCPDARYRDGTRAVVLANRACVLTASEDPVYLDTLAAAYAEAGEFAMAVKWQQEALVLTRDAKAREKSQARVALYQAKTPYREGPPAK